MRTTRIVALGATTLGVSACQRRAPSTSVSEAASVTWEGVVRHAGAPLERTVELRADSDWRRMIPNAEC